jgi:hypothetical protein
MNGKFFVNVINNFESKENNIKNILTCLDKLKDITEDVFYSINKSLSDKIERFNNLKLRIVRINKIIEILNSQNKALIIKSPRKFPQLINQNNVIKKSIFYKEITKRDLNNLYKSHYEISNKDYEKQSKQKSFLFRKFFTSHSLNVKPYNDITVNYEKNEKNQATFEKEKMDVINNINSAFLFSFIHQIESKESDNERYINKNLIEKKDIKKEIYIAPKSIREKEKIGNFRKNNIYTKFKRNIEINIPQNISLNNIIDIKIKENKEIKNLDKKEYNKTNNSDEDDSSQGNEEKNNDNEIFIPIDLIEEKNKGLKEENNDKNNFKINNINMILPNEKKEENFIQKKENNNEENNDMNIKDISITNLNEQELDNENKLVEENNINNNIEEKKPENKVLTMFEEIGDNPISKLKKIGSIKVNQIDPKEKKFTNNQFSLMEQLREQINLRFINLKKHEEKNDSNDESDSESD